jgi:aminoglycoside phosphotransferase family enzyme/predicted kinase
MNKTPAPWIQGLKNPECYSHPVAQVQLVETHISWVVLTGLYAYKIKKPVKFSFVDFSTLEKRRWFCEEEVRLNRRLAPDVYLGIVPITGSQSAPRLDGQGTPFEFAVKMKQFSLEQGIQHILRIEEQPEVCMTQLAEKIATFHAQIEKAGEHSPYGNPDIIGQSMNECLDEIPLNFLPHTTQKVVATVEKWTQEEWRKLSDIFLWRKRAGFVRECHGDLHLGNIAMFEGRVCVFDALEFEPRLRWIDVMSEVAFLVMDLEKHGRQDLAFVFLNRYLELTGDYEGLRVFRLYQVYRALVRAKVAGLRLAQLAAGGEEEERSKCELTAYVELAHRCTRCTFPALVLMHGVSGTGKTTVSSEIVKAMGAIRIRSDVERKRLFAETFKHQGKFPQDTGLYHSDITEHTYDQLRDFARTLIQYGFLVVVDATFLRHHQREKFMRLAHESRCPWFIVDVFAPQTVLTERIERRVYEGHDASDATVEVMRRQQETEEPFTQEEQVHVIIVDSTDQRKIIMALKELQEKIRG